MPCSPLDNIANSDGTLLLPMIYLMRAGEGGGGRGLRMSNLSATKAVNGDTGFLLMTRFTMVDTQ